MTNYTLQINHILANHQIQIPNDAICITNEFCATSDGKELRRITYLAPTPDPITQPHTICIGDSVKHPDAGKGTVQKMLPNNQCEVDLCLRNCKHAPEIITCPIEDLVIV